jgi:hypothetical protein
MKRKAKCNIFLLAAAAAMLNSSCATLFSSDSSVVQLNSNPLGATYTYGPFSGKTPDSIAVPKKEITGYATFAMNGYESRTVPVPTGITGVFWVNILFWPGMIVDVVTGDYQTIKVPTITADLTPVAPGAAAPASTGGVPAIPAPAPSAAPTPAPQG